MKQHSMIKSITFIPSAEQHALSVKVEVNRVWRELRAAEARNDERGVELAHARISFLEDVTPRAEGSN